MILLQFLLIITFTQISETCSPSIRRFFNRNFELKPLKPVKVLSDLSDIISDLDTKRYLYQHYARKLKKGDCHSCPEFKSPNCSMFKKSVRCVLPIVKYYRDHYCLYAHYACNNSFHAIQGRLIDKIKLDGDYAKAGEDDTKHPTYGIHILRKLNETAAFPVKKSHVPVRKYLYCMTDNRWYYRSVNPAVIIRSDQIYCI